MNSDGKLDIVVSNSFSNTVSVFLGNGAAGFATKVSYPAGTTAAKQPRRLSIADFNSDGRPDVALTLSTSDNVSLLLGVAPTAATPDGSLSTPTLYPAGAALTDVPYGLTSGDLNGDGVPDLVVALNGNTKVAVLLSQNGGFAAPVYFSAGPTTTSNPKSVALGDLDGDGNLDIVVTNELDNAISVLLNTSQ